MKFNDHFKISLIKSIIRLLGGLGGVIAIKYNPLISILILSSVIFLSELVGILEEIVDKR